MGVLSAQFLCKTIEIGYCIFEIWQFHWWCHNRLVKSWFWEKALKFENLGNVLAYTSNSKVHVNIKMLEATYRASIEDYEICVISKLTLRPFFEIFCTPVTQNLSHLTTSTFQYVESQLLLNWMVCNKSSTLTNIEEDKTSGKLCIM